MDADFLGRGAAWLEAQRRKHLTTLVRYRRGPLEVALPATLGRTVFRIDLGGGVTERITALDVLVAPDDLILFGEPKRGDVVVIDFPHRRERSRHEVLAPGNEPHWRWSDAHQRTYRIHTKFISGAPL